MEASGDWRALRGRVDALTAERQAAFALACAEGVVGSNHVLLALLQSGWEALLGGGEVTTLLASLEAGRELDDDRVAATYYALSSVRGDSKAAWGAASRAMDQAYEAVEYLDDVVAFRPVEADALSEAVQAEAARQVRLLLAAESAPTLTAAVSRMRTYGPP